ARMMRCDEVEKGFVMFDDHLSELMLDAVRLHCASPRVTWGRPGTGTLISKISKVHWTWWRLRVKKTMTAGMVSSLSAPLVAEVIRQLRTVRIIEWAGMESKNDDDLSSARSFLAVYSEERGVYVLCDSDEGIARLARHIEPGLSGKDVIEVRSQGTAARSGDSWGVRPRGSRPGSCWCRSWWGSIGEGESACGGSAQ